MSESRPKGRAGKAEAILRAARELFLRHGFEGTSMDAVTAAAGVSKPTVYAHFGTKEELLDAVVKAEAGRAPAPEAFEATGDARADLERVVGLLLRMALSPEALAWDRMMAGEARRRPEVGRIFHDNGPARIVEVLAAFLGEQDRVGALSVPDPAQAADFLFSLALGIPLLRGQLRGDVPTESEVAARASEVAGRFLRAYAPERKGR